MQSRTVFLVAGGWGYSWFVIRRLSFSVLKCSTFPIEPLFDERRPADKAAISVVRVRRERRDMNRRSISGEGAGCIGRAEPTHDGTGAGSGVNHLAECATTGNRPSKGEWLEANHDQQCQRL